MLHFEYLWSNKFLEFNSVQQKRTVLTLEESGKKSNSCGKKKQRSEVLSCDELKK